MSPDEVDINSFLLKRKHRHEAGGVGGYLSGPPVVDEVLPDGTIRGHYSPTFPNDGRCIWCGALPAEGESWPICAPIPAATPLPPKVDGEDDYFLERAAPPSEKGPVGP